MDALAETEHGQKFVSALAKDNIFAVQFHPEKSIQRIANVQNF